jgi:biotin carboxyl carrier protein
MLLNRCYEIDGLERMTFNGWRQTMNVPELERLVELVQRANISELTLRQDAARITIRKTPQEAGGGALIPYADEGGFYQNDTGEDVAAAEPLHAAEPEPIIIFAPLVGHFRHIKPMVGMGARVAKGQVVGVIEAVKLINEITSPASGRITDVLVDDGQAVEYGQELFAVQPEA